MEERARRSEAEENGLGKCMEEEEKGLSSGRKVKGVDREVTRRERERIEKWREGEESG